MMKKEDEKEDEKRWWTHTVRLTKKMMTKRNSPGIKNIVFAGISVRGELKFLVSIYF